MKIQSFRSAFLSLFLVLGFSSQSIAADTDVMLSIKNHRFEPAELKVSANQRIRLVVQNEDNGPEEFESHALNREKLIPASSKVSFFIGPLKPGRYEFIGEFNPNSAKGVIIAE